MKISTLIKGSICVLGLVGVGNFFAAPVNAGQASASGSAVVTRMDGSVVSVSGELTLPSGMFYDTNLTVTPTYGGTSAANTETITILQIVPTAAADVATASNPVSQAVADAIVAAADVSEQSSLIRAAGGSTGFTALD
ncbi:MAG: hypothetical protein AAF915_17980 [Cyanobacteria bacterium P01_D01_bin.50]